MLRRQSRQHGRDAATPEQHWHGDTQASRGLVPPGIERSLAGTQFVERPHAALVIALPILGQRQTARRAVEQSRVEPGFHATNRLGDGRAGQMQALGGSGKAAGLDRRDEYIHAIQHLAHDCRPERTDCRTIYHHCVHAFNDMVHRNEQQERVMTDRMHRWEMDGIGRERLALRDVPIPVPQAGEVLVRVSAVSLNYRDKLVIENGMGLPLAFPFTPGSDLAGRVEAIGSGVTRFATGDRVISTFMPDWIDGAPSGTARVPPYGALGGVQPGVLAQYVAFPEDWFVHAPASLDDAEASTLPCAGLTAWFALVEKGHLRAGETVLVEGTGGVALFGLQIAKALGAEAIVVSGSADKLERVKALGADHGINRTTEDWVEAVYRITGDRGADHILELVGGAHLGKAVQAAAIGGRISQIGVLEGFEIVAPAGPLMLKNLTVQGIGVGHRRALEDLVAAVDRSAIKPVIDKRYALADLPAALDRLDRGAFGKIVVDMA